MDRLVLLCAALMALCGCVNPYGASDNYGTGIAVVGVENSAVFGRCDGCGKDVKTMSRLLSRYGNPVVLVDSTATKSNVVSALTSICTNELAIFYYSGHGGSMPADDSFEVDGRDEFLCLYDGPMADNEIWEIVSRAKNRVVLVFDCCHSETMFREAGIAFKGIHIRDEPGISLLCWSGCADDGVSYGYLSGGVFTRAIARSWRADKTYDRVWKDTKKRVLGQVPKQTKIGPDKFKGKLIFR